VPPASEPQPRRPVVVLPQALAERLFRCYYGQGPRCGQAPAAVAEELAGPTPPLSEDASRLEGALPLTTHPFLANEPRGYIPRGVNARTAPSSPKKEN